MSGQKWGFSVDYAAYLKPESFRRASDLPDGWKRWHNSSFAVTQTVAEVWSANRTASTCNSCIRKSFPIILFNSVEEHLHDK